MGLLYYRWGIIFFVNPLTRVLTCAIFNYMNDQQAEQNYRQAMGLDCHEDCSAAYYRKEAQERIAKKGYKKLKGYISKAQAFLISNKT